MAATSGSAKASRDGGRGAEGSRTMRATTVRFGTDLWSMLEREAKASGVSVAQYVREAALSRLAFAAARRGDESPWSGARSEGPRLDGNVRELLQSLREITEALNAHAEAMVARSGGLDSLARAELREESHAVIAQSRQVMRESNRIQQRFRPAQGSKRG